MENESKIPTPFSREPHEGWSYTSREAHREAKLRRATHWEAKGLQ